MFARPDPTLRAEWARMVSRILCTFRLSSVMTRYFGRSRDFALVEEKMRRNLVMIGDGPDREQRGAGAQSRMWKKKTVLFRASRNGKF